MEKQTELEKNLVLIEPVLGMRFYITQEKEMKERKYAELRKNLRKTGIVTLICGSLLAAGLYLNSRYTEPLTPEQRRDYQIMQEKRPFMEGFEYLATDRITLAGKLPRSARGPLLREAIESYERAMKLCPSESDIGKRCKERYQENIFSLNRREIGDFK